MKVQELTKTEFLKKVANYEASPNKWVPVYGKPSYQRKSKFL